MENIRRRYTSSSGANYKRRSGVRQVAGDKKRRGLGEVFARQVSICIIIAAICMGVKSIENPQVKSMVGAVHDALYYDVDIAQSFAAMKATMDKVTGGNADKKPKESIPAYKQLEPEDEVQDVTDGE